MDLTEPAGWVRQFSDTIAAERDPTYRAALLAEWTAAVKHESRRLVGALVYDLRAAGYTSLEVAGILHATQQAVNTWGRRHAQANRLPWPLPHYVAPRGALEVT